MKMEFLAYYKQRHGFTLRDRLIGHMPRYASWAARAATDRKRGGAHSGIGQRPRGDGPRQATGASGVAKVVDLAARCGRAGRPVVLFADTFNNWMEPDNLAAAAKVLVHGT